eukprot:100908-Pelagomonas_calceolata.AAC.3
MISCINKSKFAAPAAHALKGSSECEFQSVRESVCVHTRTHTHTHTLAHTHTHAYTQRGKARENSANEQTLDGLGTVIPEASTKKSGPAQSLGLAECVLLRLRRQVALPTPKKTGGVAAPAAAAQPRPQMCMPTGTRTAMPQTWRVAVAKLLRLATVRPQLSS